jgi:hypothetical protein
MNELPEILLELEEHSEDGINLSPFRYAGIRDKLPTGTSYPYALLDIEEGTYTTKDRIIKSVIYTLQITIKMVDTGPLWRYITAIKTALNNSEKQYRLDIERTSNVGIIVYKIKK